MSNEPTTLAAIREQATEDGTWVNGPFEAIVKNAKAGQTPGGGNKAKPSKCCLVDPKDPNTTLNACWFGGNFLKYEDKVIRVSGKGTKVSVYNGTPEVNIGKDAVVDIIGAAPEQSAPRTATSSTGSGPKDDARGGGAPRDYESERTAEDPTVRFHKELKKITLLLLHAHQYATDLADKLPFELSEEQHQQAVASIFITAKDRGLLDKPPAPRKEVKAADGTIERFEPFVAPAIDPAVAEAEKRRKEEEAARAAEEARRKAAAHHENLDEDVPF